MKSIVYVEFPKAGLGNKLIVWGRAYIFATKYQFSLYRSSWIYLNMGPFIRRERKKRLYFLYFKRRDFASFIFSFIFPLIPKSKIKNNPIEAYNNSEFTIYHFTWDDTNNIHVFFKDNIINREVLRLGIYSLLQKKIQKKIATLESPVIGIHIRRGDYNLHALKTNDAYFIDTIKKIREKYNEKLPVTIFTDGTKEEMKPFLELGEVKLSIEKEDILDIFELSNSKICVLSFFSSFSFWAGLLCTNQVIFHPNDEKNFV